MEERYIDPFRRRSRDQLDPLRDLYRVLLHSHAVETIPTAVDYHECHARARKDFIEICKSANLGEFLEKLYREHTAPPTPAKE